jgi:hypothetical protein
MTENTTKNSSFTQKHMVASAVAKGTTNKNMGPTYIIRSPGKPAEDGFIRVTGKKCDVGAVKSTEDTKIARKSRTLMYIVCNT